VAAIHLAGVRGTLWRTAPQLLAVMLHKNCGICYGCLLPSMKTYGHSRF